MQFCMQILSNFKKLNVHVLKSIGLESINSKPSYEYNKSYKTINQDNKNGKNHGSSKRLDII